MTRTVAALHANSEDPIARALPDFNALYTEHAPFVWRVLRSMGVHPSMVPDAAQEVFIVVHRRYGEFDHRCKVRTWIYEIAARVAREHRRKYARRSMLFTPEREQEQAPEHSAQLSPASHAEQNETAQLLTHLLDKLDDDKREVLVLAEIEGLTAPEIAQVTGARLNTIYSRLRRARVEFSSLLAQHQRRAK